MFNRVEIYIYINIFVWISDLEKYKYLLFSKWNKFNGAKWGILDVEEILLYWEEGTLLFIFLFFE